MEGEDAAVGEQSVVDDEDSGVAREFERHAAARQVHAVTRLGAKVRLTQLRRRQARGHR